jgi:acetyl-CoA carboxylase carboxyl transferase subunit beta
MSWLRKLLPPRIKKGESPVRKSIPEGLWSKCPACEAVLYRSDLESNQAVCPKCGHHQRLRARARLELLLDPDGQAEIGASVLPVDPLKFKDSRKYTERLSAATNETGEADALVVMQGDSWHAGRCRVFRVRVSGRVDGVGRGRALHAWRARRRGAAAAVRLHYRDGWRADAGGPFLADADGQDDGGHHASGRRKLPFITILTDPTMGGVSASFAFMGDVVIAEPGR